MLIIKVFKKILFVIFPLCLCLLFSACPEGEPAGIYIEKVFCAEESTESISLDDDDWELRYIELSCLSSEGKDSIIYNASYDRFFKRTIEDSLCLDKDSVFVETNHFCVYKDKAAPKLLNVKMKTNEGQKRYIRIGFWSGGNYGDIWATQKGLKDKE